MAILHFWAFCLLGPLFALTATAQQVDPLPVLISEPEPTLYTKRDTLTLPPRPGTDIPPQTKGPRTTTTPAPCINDHFIVFPKSFRPGHKLPVFIHISGGSSGNVDVNVSLIVWDSMMGGFSRRATMQMVLATEALSMPVGTSELIELDVPDGIQTNQYFLLNATGSGALEFHDTQDVFVTWMLNATFIQTDKATYRPNEEVKFWIFAIYPNMTTVHTSFDVEIQDPRRNIISESTIDANSDGLAEGSLMLPEKPPTGDWYIITKLVGSWQQERKKFTVEEYTLPRFQVVVTLPPYIITTDPGVTGKISVRYVYDEPVSGDILITVTLQPSWCSSRYSNCKMSNSPHQIFMPLIDGEATFDMDMDVLRGLSYFNNSDIMSEMMHVVANATEGVTQIVMSGQASTKFYNYIGQVTFPFGVPAFKPGLLYRILVMVADPSGDPLTTYTSQLNVTIYQRNCTYTPMMYPTLQGHNESSGSSGSSVASSSVINPRWPGMTICLITRLYSDMHNINDSGVVLVELPDTFSFDTSDSYWRNVYIKSSYGNINNSRVSNLEKAESEDNSFMRITLADMNPSVGDILTVSVVSTPAISRVFYSVVSKGQSLVLKQYDIPGGQALTTFDFTFRITQEMTPRARLVVWHSETSQIVADGISFAVKGLFQNQVSLSFQKQEFLPDDETELTIQGDPGSLAAVLTVDKSLLIHRSGNRILNKHVMNAMRNFDFGYGGGFFIDIMWYGGRWPIWRPDRNARDIFNEGGIIAIPACLRGPRDKYFIMTDGDVALAAPANSRGSGSESLATQDSSDLAEVQLERKIFPETFIWQIVKIGPTGRATISTRAPHTITTWVSSAFALNDNSGLGIAPETEMRVYRPFFVSMNVPRTAIRGETLLVQVLVFNYHDKGMEVLVTFAHSATYSLTVESNGVGSAYFPMRPLSAGTLKLHAMAQSTDDADAVERSIEILFEGIESCNTVSYLILLDDATPTFSDEVDVTFPTTLVPDSVRVMAYITGDTMIGVLRNPERLVRLPSGCGEQTIKTFAPLVHVLNYFNSRGTLPPKKREEAIQFLMAGYINELKFQHLDDSFSSWGPRGSSDPTKTGQMALTAYVVKSFKAARAHIFIDPHVISGAVRWIFSHQNIITGQFNHVGRSYSNRFKGDVLTAYVLIAILDGGLPPDMTPAMADGIERAADYIAIAAESDAPKSKPYHLAMYAYALTLAGRVSNATLALGRLEALKEPSGLMSYWFNNPNRNRWWWCWHCGRSEDIETASYAILTYKWRGDIVDAFMVLRWLVKQQRANGGFTSTQDTALAIQAMSAISIDMPETVSMEVLLKTEFFQVPVTINDANKMEVQTFPVALPLNVSAVGNGAALVKIEYCYHAIEPDMPDGFDLSATIDDETLMSFTLVICFRYRNGDSTDGMVVIEIGLPTGFLMDNITGTYVNIEVGNRKVVVYLDEVTSMEQCLILTASRAGRQSSGTKEVSVDIINYYDPDETACTTYELTKDGGNYCLICQGACTVC